jgi:ABC-type cobalamin/Fe3+-siderophores transport system ATPase subunit
VKSVVSSPPPLLEVTHLDAGYSARPVLHAIDLNLAPGTVMALIGPNGAGKSTLIKALSGVIPVRSGTVSVGGHPLHELSTAQRARWLAVVPQARNLPPAFTAWETVAMGRTPYLNWLGQLSEKDETAVRQAMQRTDTQALADRPVGELSGGEQQRLLVARALAQSAPILLLDEPTTHLDLQHQLNLLTLARSLAHQDGLAVLVALHDLNMVARYADQVALMVEGRLQISGAPSEVLEAERLSAVYHVPLKVVTDSETGVVLIIPR